jgi:hypothetical protein
LSLLSPCVPARVFSLPCVVLVLPVLNRLRLSSSGEGGASGRREGVHVALLKWGKTSSMSDAERKRGVCSHCKFSNHTKYDCENCKKEFCSDTECTSLDPRMMRAFTNYYGSWNCKNCMECPRAENPRDVGKDGGGSGSGDGEEEAVWEAIEVLRRGGDGGTTKVLLTLCELVIQQSNKVNKLKQEHNMRPQLPSLMAGPYRANKEIRRGPAPEKGSMFKKEFRHCRPGRGRRRRQCQWTRRSTPSGCRKMIII